MFGDDVRELNVVDSELHLKYQFLLNNLPLGEGTLLQNEFEFLDPLLQGSLPRHQSLFRVCH